MRRCALSALLPRNLPDRMTMLLQSPYHYHHIIRHGSKFHKKVIRTAVKVYQPGEHIPQPGERPVEKMTLPPSMKLTPAALKNLNVTIEEDDPNKIFCTVMGRLKFIDAKKKVALEGTRLILEALSTGLIMETLFIAENVGLPREINAALTKSSSLTESYQERAEGASIESTNDSQNSHSVKILKVSIKNMRTWSSLTTPPGIIGIFRKPKAEDLMKKESAMPVTVICDNIREPGNLGALLRAAVGAGCKRVLLSKGCVDAWESKVLRAGSGAHFYMPITAEIPIHEINSYITFDSLEESSQKDLDVADASMQTSKAKDTHDQKRNRPRDTHSSPVAIFLADSNTEDPRTDIPIVSYTDVDYSQYGNIYIVIGGETEGLSADSFRIAHNLSRSHYPLVGIQRLRIPLQCDMESLNVAHAFAIIAFEILRQRQKQTPVNNYIK